MTHKATIGTISHGTLRSEDLLEAFAAKLDWLDKGNALAAEAELHLASSEDEVRAEDWDDVASELVNDLQDALQEHAPAYCYFGTLEGDGSDFGFWPCIEEIQEIETGIDDPSELDGLDDDVTECRYVNDHGNVTVFCRFDAEWRAVLEIV